MVDGQTWAGRVLALREQHLGEWAKFGPFSTTKAAHNRASSSRTAFHKDPANNGFILDTVVAMSDGVPCLWLRVDRVDETETE